MRRWRVYYDDGSTFSSDEPDALLRVHPRDVQVVLNEAPGTRHGFHVVTSKDYYVYRSDLGLWYGCDILGFFMYMFVNPQPGFKVALAGSTSEDYSEIMKRAMREGLG